MAARKSHRYLSGADRLNSADLGDQFVFEFDEADVWSTKDNINLPETKKPVYPNPRPLRKPQKKNTNVDHLSVGPKSLPVSIPDWSKILGGEYRMRVENDYYEEEEEEDDGNDRIPPHEYLARTRVASFSVHEGIGRTLKGRDLSRVRNAIWKQTGFELD